MRDAPRFVAHYIRHREAREASILHRLAKGAADIPTLVRAIYIGLDPRLTGAAGLSVLAHLEDLVARGVVATDGAAVDRRHLPARRRRLRLDRLLDLLDQAEDALRIGAEIVPAVARRGADIEPRAAA